MGGQDPGADREVTPPREGRLILQLRYPTLIPFTVFFWLLIVFFFPDHDLYLILPEEGILVPHPPGEGGLILHRHDDDVPTHLTLPGKNVATLEAIAGVDQG